MFEGGEAVGWQLGWPDNCDWNPFFPIAVFVQDNGCCAGLVSLD